MTPTDIHPVGNQELLITWSDGHRSLYTFHDLRLHCPCAGCVDELTGQRKMTPHLVAQNIQPAQIEPVGRYALRFHWNDGHQTGIYSYSLLRALCPCPQCSSKANSNR